MYRRLFSVCPAVKCQFYALPRTIHMYSGVFNARVHLETPVCALPRFESVTSGLCKVSLH